MGSVPAFPGREDLVFPSPVAALRSTAGDQAQVFPLGNDVTIVLDMIEPGLAFEMIVFMQEYPRGEAAEIAFHLPAIRVRYLDLDGRQVERSGNPPNPFRSCPRPTGFPG